MQDDELQKLVERISLESFGKPFKHRAYFNGRLKTTGGRYHLKDHNIDINRKMADVISEDELIGIIKHELVHYHLHLAGYSANHRSKEFKQLLKAVGGSRYAPNLKAKSTIYYFYQCTNCGQIYRRKRWVNISRFVCSKCRGKLKLVKKE